MLAKRRRLARLIAQILLVLVAFTAGPALTDFRRAERANRAYGPAQRVAEWLLPGRRDAPPLIPSAASELAGTGIVPAPASLAFSRLAADSP